MKINGDTEIPSDLIKEWNNLLKILNDLDSVAVNRNFFVNYENDPIMKHELHGFSDESLHANLTTTYVKTILQSWKLQTNVFTAISRIDSLKEIIIPCLELLGNLILARFMNSVKIAMKKDAKIDNVYYSATNIFLDNRVKNIKRLSGKLSWLYSESKNNPSDLLTKYVSPGVNRRNKIMVGGTYFLKKHNIKLQSHENDFIELENLDITGTAKLLVLNQRKNDGIDKILTLGKLVMGLNL